MNKVLITGSQGFTGSYLREALTSRGFSVTGLVNETPHDEEIQADLTCPEALRDAVAMIQPDYVIHLAGISNVIHQDNNALYQINCHGALNLLAAIQQEASSTIKKIILASSAYIYGNANGLISEKVCPKPINHYAMSKLSMEYMAQSLYENLPIVIVRPFNYTGVGQQSYVLIPKIVQHFAEKAAVIRLGNMHVYREFNDVRMAAHVYSQLLTQAQSGTVVNICTGKNYCLKDILELIEKISGHHPEIIIDPAFVRPNESPMIAGDPTLLQSIVQDLPQYTLEDTLRWMFSAHQ